MGFFIVSGSVLMKSSLVFARLNEREIP